MTQGVSGKKAGNSWVSGSRNELSHCPEEVSLC